MPENCPLNVAPYSQSELIQSPRMVNLNYTNQDFWSMKSRLVDFINERFGPNGTVLPNTFNDLVESSIAIMLIENFAFLADTLSFKMDQIVNELFIDTVGEIENAFRLSKLVGFKPLPPIASKSLWAATISNPISKDIILETPSSIEIALDGSAISFELYPADSAFNPLFDEEIIIPAGATSNINIVGLEGRTVTDVFTGNGEIGQNYRLSNRPVIYDSIKVEVNGVIWSEVDYFTDSQPRREFRVEFDSSYNGFVIFGNNRAGMIPSANSEIRITYRIGGGVRGNIVTNFVSTQKQASVDGFQFNIPVTLRNYTRGQNGYDGDTIQDVKNKLPAYLRTQDRAVTGLDYKTLTDQFATAYHGKIGKSNVVLRNHGCAGNIVDIYILADDGGDLISASNELKISLTEYLNTKKMITDFVCIRNGSVLSVDVSVEVVCDKFFRKFEPEILENIKQRVTNFFSLNNWEYGKTLHAPNLVKELSDIRQAKSVEITFVADEPDAEATTTVTSKFYQIIRPGIINITFVYE